MSIPSDKATDARGFLLGYGIPADAVDRALRVHAHELAEIQRAWAQGPRWVTALERSAVDHVTALIDPEASE